MDKDAFPGRIFSGTSTQINTPPPEFSGPALTLRREEQGLTLSTGGDLHLKSRIRVDYATPSWRRRLLRVRSEPLVRAMGRAGVRGVLVLDATAGLGRDTFLLAGAGYRVWACERHPVLAALLEDGLTRAREDHRLEPIAARIRFSRLDSRKALTMGPRPDIVYLDPMFTARGSAQVGKELQIVRALIGKGENMGSLFALARKRARLRVVVKRSRRDGVLDGVTPSYSRQGRTVRFDVYLSGP